MATGRFGIVIYSGVVRAGIGPTCRTRILTALYSKAHVRLHSKQSDSGRIYTVSGWTEPPSSFILFPL